MHAALELDHHHSPAARSGPALLHTAEGIAVYIGMPVDATRHLIAKRVLPTFRIGRTVVARRESIDRWIVEQERGAMSDG